MGDDYIIRNKTPNSLIMTPIPEDIQQPNGGILKDSHLIPNSNEDNSVNKNKVRRRIENTVMNFIGQTPECSYFCIEH